MMTMTFIGEENKIHVKKTATDEAIQSERILTHKPTHRKR